MTDPRTRLTARVRAIFWLFALLVLGWPLGNPAYAQRGATGAERIAAVVNDEVISYTDVITRTKLAILSSGLPNNEDTQQRLIPQVLRGLIDEKLQMQEARRNNIQVSDDEVSAALTSIAQQNGMSVDRLTQGLRSRGVPITTMRSQIISTLAWRKLVQRRLRPSVQIGEDEIDAAMRRMEANAGSSEYLLAEIFLSVDSPQQEDSVRRLAERLVSQIRRGANFVAVARQFSQAAGAATGGDLGWVQPGQLTPALDEALRSLRPGQLSNPIRSQLGYHILLVRDRRVISIDSGETTQVTMKQIVFPIPSEGDRQTVAERAARTAAGITSCSEFDRAMAQAGPGLSGTLGPVSVSGLPEDLREFALTLPVGSPSQPLMAQRQAVLLIVCDRQSQGGAAAARESIANSIGADRLELLQRRYLRDLRQSAFIEIRL